MHHHQNRKRSVRIIAGQWKRRILYFPNLPDLRPTQDRVRETLFNWLTPYIKQSTCLDLFAGSGVLGFEALSRGARRVSLVDHHPTVITHLRNTAHQLNITAQHIEIIQGNSLQRPPPLTFSPYDIVFLDPPFQALRHSHPLLQIVQQLEQTALLSEDALMYIEADKAVQLNLPGWVILKTAKTKRLAYYLMQRQR